MPLTTYNSATFAFLYSLNIVRIYYYIVLAAYGRTFSTIGYIVLRNLVKIILVTKLKDS